MKKEGEMLKQLRPKLGKKDLDTLRVFDAFMDENHIAISERLRKELVNDPLLGPVFSQQTEEEQKAQDQRFRKMQKAAIREGRWDDYTRDLLEQGVAYANMGLRFSDWSYIVKIYRDFSRPFVVERLSGNVPKLMAVLDGLNKLIDYALNVVAESYFLEKNKLVEQADKKKQQALEKLKASEQRFKALFENSPDYIYAVDPEGRIEYINRVAEGLKLRDVIGSNLFDYQTEDSRKLVEEAVQQVFKNGKATAYTHEAELPDGTRHYTSSVAPIFEGKKVRSVAIISRDETERMIINREMSHLKDQLERKIQQLDVVLKVGKIGVWDWDLDTGYIDWDETMYALYDLPRSKFKNRYEDFENRVHPDDRLKVQKAVQDSLASGRDFNTEFRVVHQDGSIHFLTGRGRASYDADGNPRKMTGSNMDITEIISKQVEIDNIKHAIYKSNLVVEFTPDGVISYINDPFLKLMGYTSEELIGQHHSVLVSKPLKESAEYRDFWDRLGRGEYQEGEFPRLTKNQDIVWIKGNYNPISDPDGKVYRILKLATDISPMKKAEQEILKFNKQLEDKVAQRTADLQATNKELEDFTYTVSHDLRAPIRAISGFTKVLGKSLDGKLDDQGQHYFNVIVENAGRMGELIDDLLAFSRMGRTEKKYVNYDMEALVREVYNQLTQIQDKSKINLTVHALPNSPSDRDMIRHVWSNLLDNAIKYSSTKDEINIKISSEEKENLTIYKIEDNGVGFETEYAGKLFGMFQRLHAENEFEGTGVGLAIVHKIIERHGGEVWAESILDQGSTFYFTLPKQQT